MTDVMIDVQDSQISDHRVAIPLPNGYMRAALLAIHEIAGHDALYAMLRFMGMQDAINDLPPDNLKFDAGYVFRDYANLNHALIEFYGRSGKVHALRIGRTSARWMIENHPLFGYAGVAFKAMNTTQAIRWGIHNTADGFRKLYQNIHFDIRIHIEEDNEQFTWRSPDCPCCVGKRSNTPICWIWEAGILEAASFVTGGQQVDVHQTHCIARGDSQCAWRIGKL
ncbi:MAG: V4R domain-containing protein [Anaerolineales bacterium]